VKFLDELNKYKFPEDITYRATCIGSLFHVDTSNYSGVSFYDGVAFSNIWLYIESS